MVVPRSPMLHSLAAVSSVGAPLTLLIPDTLPSTLQLLVSLLYGNATSVPAQSYPELCSLCTSLDLQNWLHREVQGEDSGENSTGSCEVELKEKSKEKNANSDELRCEICRKKYLNAARLQWHYNSAHEEAPAPLITQRTRGAQKLEQQSLKATSSLSEYAALPLSRRSPIKRKLSKTHPSPIKVLRSETEANVGRSPDKCPRSIFLPWKLQEVEEGRVAFRWQQNYFNRELCQNKRVTKKQKEFGCLWNNFLWVEVYLQLMHYNTS